jgi:phenylacetate-CoA ligase
MQLVQNSLNEVVINRVKGQDYSDKTDALLLEAMREVFNENVTLTIQDVSNIPQEPSGKYRFSICKV